MLNRCCLKAAVARKASAVHRPPASALHRPPASALHRPPAQMEVGRGSLMPRPPIPSGTFSPMA
eukprot:1323217-Prymnesium_polylepis.1